MNYSIFPFLLIIIPLAAILIIIVRKFPQAALLNVENLPEVKVEKKKREVLRRRAVIGAERTRELWRKRWRPILEKLKKLQRRFRLYVGKVEARLRAERQGRREKPKPLSAAAKTNARSLVQEADSLRQADDREGAEKKYLAAIRLYPKNVDAYRGLAAVYLGEGQTEQARETYKFILQLNPRDGETMVKLAELYEEEGDAKAAIEYYQKAVLLDDHYAHRFAKLAQLLQKLGEHKTALEAARQAVELEPGNPKYLDSWAELCILSHHQAEAEEAYQKLRLVNPENQKLAVFRERIDGMVDSNGHFSN